MVPGSDLGSPAGVFALSAVCARTFMRPVNVVPMSASAPTVMASRLE
jgi:hypothetical protein